MNDHSDTRRPPALLTGLTVTAAAVMLGACGGGQGTRVEGADGERAQREQFEAAALKHAECMRRHGIEVPDPEPGGGGLFQLDGPEADGSPTTQRRAMEACDKHLDDVPPPKLNDEQKNELRDSALEHARCMREQGIDFPDPRFGSDGTVSVQIGEGLEPADPAVERAEKACAKHRPGAIGGAAEPAT